MAQGRRYIVDWKRLSIGPAIAYHAGCIVGNYLYVHGGITTKHDRYPSNGFHRYDIDGDNWKDLSTAPSPHLSHHACVVLDGRYIVFIGGWNGSSRVADVYAYDVTETKWCRLLTSGFTDQGGLSSHTATLFRDGAMILVIGREGSLRTQRRYGNGFTLHVDLKQGSAVYSPFDRSIDSRSGHTADGVGNSLYVIGGRSDHLVVTVPIKMHHTTKCARGIAIKIADAITHLHPMKKGPSGRKSHGSLALGDGLLVYGGETFDGRSRDPVGELLFLRTKPLDWFLLGSSDVVLAGHVMCATEDRILLHGGEGRRGLIHGEMYELVG